MKELIAQLIANGIQAVAVTLQKITCSDGSTIWAYSSLQPRKKAKLFGTTVDATCSTLDTSVPRAKQAYSTKLVTTWLNGFTDAQAQEFGEKWGTTAIAIVLDDGTVETHTLEQARALLPVDVSAPSEPVPAPIAS